MDIKKFFPKFSPAISLTLVLISILVPIIAVDRIYSLNIWPCTYGENLVILDFSASCPNFLGFELKFPAIFLLIFLLIFSYLLYTIAKKSRKAIILSRSLILLGLVLIFLILGVVYYSKWRSYCRAVPVESPILNMPYIPLKTEIKCPPWFNPIEWVRFEKKYRESIYSKPAVPKTVSNIELTGNINISLIEKLISETSTETKEDQKKIMVKLATEEQFGCLGYRIDTAHGIMENEIIIYINGITAPGGNCPAAIGPAEFKMNLGNLSGEYKLIIGRENQQDSYKVNISDEKIIVEPIKVSFTNLTDREVWRFPESTILVQCWINQGDLCSRFTDDLIRLGTVNSDRNSYLEYIKRKTDFNEPSLELYSYSGNNNHLAELIRQYAQVTDSMISISSWDGEQYFTWVMREKGDLNFQNLKLPDGVFPGQIQKSFIFGNTRYALVLQPSMNIYLGNLPKNILITFSGVLVNRPGDKEWVKAWQIIDEIPEQKNNPYFMWKEGEELLLAVVDQNGAGSGEGNLTLVRLGEDRSEKISCFYFGENYGDVQNNAGYLESAKLLGKPQIEENCSQWSLQKVNP